MTDARYTVTGFDAAVDGMERLRNQDEFILLAYPSADSTVADLRSQWESDLQVCDRPDGFDYDAARATIAEFCEERADYLRSEILSLSLYMPEEELEDCEGATFRLYVTDSSEGN